MDPNNREHAVMANWANKHQAGQGRSIQDEFLGKGTSLDDDPAISNSVAHQPQRMPQRSVTADSVAGPINRSGGSRRSADLPMYTTAEGGPRLPYGAPSSPDTYENSRAAAPPGGWGGQVATRMEEDKRIAAANQAKSANAAQVAELRKQRRANKITEEEFAERLEAVYDPAAAEKLHVKTLKLQRQRRREFEEANGLASMTNGDDSGSRRTDSSGSSWPGAPQRKTRPNRTASADDASSHGPGVSKNWAEVQDAARKQALVKAFQFERPSDAPQPFVPGRDGPIPRRPAPANGPSGEMAWGTAWGQLGPPPPGYRGGGGGGYGGDANGGDGSDTSSSTDSEDDPNASKRAHAMEKKREAELHSLRLKIQAKKNGWEAKRLVREEKYQRKQEEKENALRRKQQKAHKKQQRIELDAVRAKIAEEKRKAKEGDVTDEETEQERKERWHDIHHDGTGTRANLDAVGRPRHLFHKKGHPNYNKKMVLNPTYNGNVDPLQRRKKT